MWIYEKKLQFPVKIKNPNPTLANLIVSQLGGADGELAAATRYLNQRYAMPNGEIIGILTDVGTEETETAPFKVPCFLKDMSLPNLPCEASPQEAPFRKPC